jgi:hypothetical protein
VAKPELDPEFVLGIFRKRWGLSGVDIYASTCGVDVCENVLTVKGERYEGVWAIVLE